MNGISHRDIAGGCARVWCLLFTHDSILIEPVDIVSSALLAEIHFPLWIWVWVWVWASPFLQCAMYLLIRIQLWMSLLAVHVMLSSEMFPVVVPTMRSGASSGV